MRKQPKSQSTHHHHPRFEPYKARDEQTISLKLRSAYGLLPQKHQKNIINHNPHSMFFRLHIPYLCLSLLICFSCAFILAKHTNSPLNIMEWLWILIGASCIHPLTNSICILSILCLHNRWIKTLCILALGWPPTRTHLVFRRGESMNIVAVDTELVHQLIGLWLLGVFFFVHSFQLSQKTMK